MIWLLFRRLSALLVSVSGPVSKLSRPSSNKVSSSYSSLGIGGVLTVRAKEGLHRPKRIHRSMWIKLLFHPSWALVCVRFVGVHLWFSSGITVETWDHRTTRWVPHKCPLASGGVLTDFEQKVLEVGPWSSYKKSQSPQSLAVLPAGWQVFYPLLTDVLYTTYVCAYMPHMCVHIRHKQPCVRYASCPLHMPSHPYLRWVVYKVYNMCVYAYSSFCISQYADNHDFSTPWSHQKSCQSSKAKASFQENCTLTTPCLSGGFTLSPNLLL